MEELDLPTRLYTDDLARRWGVSRSAAQGVVRDWLRGRWAVNVPVNTRGRQHDVWLEDVEPWERFMQDSKEGIPGQRKPGPRPKKKAQT